MHVVPEPKRMFTQTSATLCFPEPLPVISSCFSCPSSTICCLGSQRTELGLTSLGFRGSGEFPKAESQDKFGSFYTAQCLSSFPSFLALLVYVVYLSGRLAEREKRSQSSMCGILLLKWLHSQGWFTLKTGIRYSTQVSHISDRGQELGLPSTAFPDTLAWSWLWNAEARTPNGALIWDTVL